MPPSSSEQPISRSAHCWAMSLAGGGRAGEADVVGALDHRRTELAAGAGDHVPQTLREAGLLEQLGAEQRRQHRLGVGLGDHRVAGEQRGQPVAERHRERVVPGRDDPDDALGHVVDLDPGQPGHDAELALGVEVVVRRARVVARGQRDVQRLVERVLARLARLPADQVDDLVLAVEDQVVQAQQQLRERCSSVVCAHACWARRARAKASLTSASLDCGIIAERLAGERGVRRDRLARGRDHPAGQRPDVRRVEGVRRRRVVLGIGGADVLTGGGVGGVGLGAHGLSVDPAVTLHKARLVK